MFTDDINFAVGGDANNRMELKQKWVQVYTVENNLIIRMEEFATSEVAAYTSQGVNQ